MHTIQELRQMISLKPSWHNRQYLHTPLLPMGLPRGAITQICGFGKTEAAVEIIKANPSLKAAWIEAQFELNPMAVAQRDVDLTRLLFAEAGEHMLWTCHQVLKSHLFPIVVLKNSPMEDVALRRLQLAAEKSQASLILLTEEFSSNWPVSLLLKAHRTACEPVELDILRQRQ